MMHAKLAVLYHYFEWSKMAIISPFDKACWTKFSALDKLQSVGNSKMLLMKREALINLTIIENLSPKIT